MLLLYSANREKDWSVTWHLAPRYMSAHVSCSHSSGRQAVPVQIPAPPGEVWPHVSDLLGYVSVCKALHVEKETTGPLLGSLGLWSLTPKNILCYCLSSPGIQIQVSSEQMTSPTSWLMQNQYSSAKITEPRFIYRSIIFPKSPSLHNRQGELHKIPWPFTVFSSPQSHAPLLQWKIHTTMWR